MLFSVELLNCKFSTCKSLKFFIYDLKTLLICWIDNFPLAKTWKISCISSKRCWFVELPNIQWQKLFNTCRRTLSGKSNMRHSPLNCWIANFPLAKAWNFLYTSSKRCWFVELIIFHFQKLEKFHVWVPNAVDLLNCNFSTGKSFATSVDLLKS